MPHETELWYFAYGANLDPAILIERRGIVPMASRRAILHGYQLVFDQPGIPWLEPSFANLAPDEAGAVHGVAYRLSPEQLEELDALEGDGAYDHLDVSLEVEDGPPVMAKTYVTYDTEQGLLPSRRYMGLLIRGAREHGLHEEWIHRLETQPTSGSRGLALIAPLLMRCFEMGFRARRAVRRLLER